MVIFFKANCFSFFGKYNVVLALLHHWHSRGFNPVLVVFRSISVYGIPYLTYARWVWSDYFSYSYYPLFLWNKHISVLASDLTTNYNLYLISIKWRMHIYYHYYSKRITGLSSKISSIMNRRFLQWWSTIPPISTKLTITSHGSHRAQKLPRHMTLQIQVLAKRGKIVYYKPFLIIIII